MSQRMQRLREAGYKLTNVRKAVIEALEQGGGHMTSSEIIDAVARLDPGIGRASVFRTLDLLTSLTIIRPTYIDSHITPTYVMLPEGHHHHIVCTQCHQVIEFADCGLQDLIERLESQYDVAVTGHLLEFFGVCADCRETPGSRADVE